MMMDFTNFESREARLSCSPAEYFDFITDLRNFGSFIPSDIIKDWKADNDTCHFSISSMGEVNLKTASKTPYSSVVFSGNVLITTEFRLHSVISSDSTGKAKVRLLMEAGLSPILKMVGSGIIERFLETLVAEMEKFESWNAHAV